MQEVTFTYKFMKDKPGYSVYCLDWDAVFTCGDDLSEMYKNAKELTEGYLEMLRDGQLSKTQHPKITPHGHNKNYFKMTFDTVTCKMISGPETEKHIRKQVAGRSSR